MDTSILYIRELRKTINSSLPLIDRISLALASNEINRKDLEDLLNNYREEKERNERNTKRIYNLSNQCEEKRKKCDKYHERLRNLKNIIEERIDETRCVYCYREFYHNEITAECYICEYKCCKCCVEKCLGCKGWKILEDYRNNPCQKEICFKCKKRIYCDECGRGMCSYCSYEPCSLCVNK